LKYGLLSNCLVSDNKLKHPELALRRTPVLHICFSTVVWPLPGNKTVLALSQTRGKKQSQKDKIIREIRME
jgi:hypothetical protein